MNRGDDKKRVVLPCFAPANENIAFARSIPADRSFANVVPSFDETYNHRWVPTKIFCPSKKNRPQSTIRILAAL